MIISDISQGTTNNKKKAKNSCLCQKEFKISLHISTINQTSNKNKPQKGRKWGNSLLETSLRHNIEVNGLGHTISSLPVEEIDYETN